MLFRSEEEREQFFRTLSSILRENTTIKILFSLREEYLGHLYAYEYFLPNLFEHRFRVEAMQDDTVVEVISRTCRVHGIQMEKGNDIPGIIVAHLKQGKRPVHLPYLQIYLYALYGKAMEGYGKARFDKALIEDPDNSLEKVLYRFIGGKLAEAQAFLQEKHQQLPLDFAEKLLDDFATEIGTKKAWRIAELAEKYRLSPPLIKDALQYFAETAKLLRADENEVERYEPVHDVVAQQIHERRSEESKEYKLFLSQLNVYLSQWERDNRSAERLLRGSDVAKAEICRKRLEREERGNLYVEYVQLSREYVTKTRRAEKQQLKKEQDLRKTAEEALVEAEEQRNLAQANEGKAKRFLRMAYGVALALMIAAIAAVYLYTETNKNYRTIERKEIERKAQELLSFGDNYKDLGKSMDASNNYQAALNLLNKHLPDYPELKETQLYQQLLKK